MVTLAQAVADRTSALQLVATLSGHGSGGSQIAYCAQTPTNAMAGITFRPWVEDRVFPDLLAEKSPALGGVVSASEFSLALVDIDDTLTSEFRIDAEPVATIAADIDKGTASVSFDLDTASGVDVGDYIYVGSEVMKVSAKAAPQITCARTQYDTEAQKHYAGAAVFAYMPTLLDRRLRVYLMPVDADDWAEKYEVGTFFVTGYTLDPSKNTWRLTAKSELRFVQREVATEPVTVTVQYSSLAHPNLTQLALSPLRGQRITNTRVVATWDPWDEDEGWLKIGDEVIGVDIPSGRFNWTYATIARRGQFNTPIDKDKPAEEDQASVVMGADTTGPCAFRYDPNNTETTRSSAWIKSDHPVDIMLCILTSSAHEDDGLELVNGGALGNWSCLPVGYGLGIPYDRIDVQSFLDVKSKASYAFPNFYFGEQPVSFAELITKNFLRPLGLQVTSKEGKLALRFPTLPLSGSSTATWDEAVWDAYVKNDLVWQDSVVGGPDTSNVYNVVQYRTPSPFKGKPDLATFRDRDFDGWNVARGDFSEDRTLVVEVPGMTLAQEAQFWDLAARRLLRFYRPLWKLKLRTWFDQYERVPGDIIALTHADLPNTETGVRGWSGVLAVVLSREFVLADGDNAGIDWEILSYGPSSKFGRIAPSAYIVSAAAAGGGNYTLSITSSLFTASDAQNSLHTSDGSAFNAGDVLHLMNPDVSNAAGVNTAAVVSSTTNSVTVDGDFGGNLDLAGGQFIGYAERADQVAAQSAAYVSLAGKTATPPVIDGSSDKPWRFGDG